jgi:transcriptional regulator with XRE-family HTH domain
MPAHATAGRLAQLSRGRVLHRVATKTQLSKRIRAAALLGQGRTRASVAAELGIDRATISRWRRDEHFRNLEQQAREHTLDAKPGVRATLEAALTATKPGGQPDWPTRVQAARTLLGAPEEEMDAPVVVTRRIFVQPDGSEVEA